MNKKQKRIASLCLVVLIAFIISLNLGKASITIVIETDLESQYNIEQTRQGYNLELISGKLTNIKINGIKQPPPVINSKIKTYTAEQPEEAKIATEARSVTKTPRPQARSRS